MIDFTERRIAMVDTQVRPSDVTKFPIIDAMLKISREQFLPNNLRSIAYIGDHISLKNNRVLLDPRIFAKMLDALELKTGELVLVIGCGNGYGVAVMSQIAEAVVGIDEPDMCSDAEECLASQEIDNAYIVEGVLNLGNKKHGPYDSVFIEGGVEEIPMAIIEQLKDGGRMVALFADGIVGRVMLGIKKGKNINWRFEFNAMAPILNGFEKEKEFNF
ncbi:MAG: protein-L-isoaspartate O-methyltransferase [Rhodobacteraceae bacterium]|nr:protein-L-isoaspartate O-methyltransferase [Paracoccaceae bacterium]